MAINAASITANNRTMSIPPLESLHGAPVEQAARLWAFAIGAFVFMVVGFALFVPVSKVDVIMLGVGQWPER